MTNPLSRRGLNHPAQDRQDYAQLYADVEALYQTLGDDSLSRWFTSPSLANGATVTLVHGLNLAFSELDFRFYTYTGTFTANTTPITRLPTGITVAPTSGFATTKIDVTNNTGGTISLATLVLQLQPEAGAALPVLGLPARAKLAAIASAVDANSDLPLRIYAAATPDASLHVSASTSTMADGATRVPSPIDATGPAYSPAGSIHFGTGTVTGGGTVTLNGAAFATGFAALTKTDTLYRRFTFSLLRDGTLASISSPESASQGALADYGALAASAGGIYLSHIDVQWVAGATQYKTAGSASNVIENGGIYRGSAGGGGGASASVSPVAFRLAKQAIGSVGSAGQVKAGHYLDAKSFPADIPLATTYWWNFQGNGNDGSGHGKTLGTIGSISYGASDIKGASGSPIVNASGYYERLTDSDVNQTSTSLASAGWFYLSDWQSASQVLFVHGQDATDCRLTVSVSGGVLSASFANSSATSYDLSLSVSTATIPNGAWAHVAVTYDYANTTATLYINGQYATSGTIANIRAATLANLDIGANYGGTLGLVGASVNAFLHLYGYALTAADVRKLASYRYDHAKNIQPQFQEWSGNVYEASKGTCNQDISWLVAKEDPNSVFWEFVDAASTDQVDLALADGSLSAHVVSANNFDHTYTSAPSFPIAHGLGDVFLPVILQQLPDLTWEPVDAQGYLTVTATQLDGDLAPLFTAGAVAVRVLGALANPATAIVKATADQAGLVTSYAPIVKSSVIGLTTNYAILDNDGLSYLAFDTISGNRNCNLPDATLNPGRIITIKKGDTFQNGYVTVTATGGQTVDGVVAFNLISSYDAVTVISDGANWRTLAFNYGTLKSDSFGRLRSRSGIDFGGELTLTNGASTTIAHSINDFYGIGAGVMHLTLTARAGFDGEVATFAIFVHQAGSCVITNITNNHLASGIAGGFQGQFGGLPASGCLAVVVDSFGTYWSIVLTNNSGLSIALGYRLSANSG